MSKPVFNLPVPVPGQTTKQSLDAEVNRVFDRLWPLAEGGASAVLDDVNDARDRAELAATEAALYDGPKVDTFDQLATVTPAMLPVGAFLRAVELNAVYQRAPDDAPDAHLDYTAAAGVKLYVLATAVVDWRAYADLQGAIDAAIANDGSTRPRREVISDPAQMVYTSDGFLIDTRTIGLSGLSAQYTGAAGGDLVTIRNSPRSKLSDFVLLGDDIARPRSAIFLRADDLASSDNENNIIERGVIGRRYTADTTEGGSLETVKGRMFDYGILAGLAFDGNNDEHIIRDVQIHSCAIAAIFLNGVQHIWTSIENVLCNDSDLGIRNGSNFTGFNLSFNRIDTADIRGVRNTDASIFGLNSENFNRAIWSQGGASYTVIGGKLLAINADHKEFVRCENGGRISLEKMVIGNNGAGGVRFFYRSGTVKAGFVKVYDCQIDDGNLRDTWDIDTGAATALPVDIDISVDGFRWKTKRPYGDRQVTPPAVANEASGLIASGAIASQFGTLWNVAYQRPLGNQHLSFAPDSVAQVRARLLNVSGGSITLDAGRMRWADMGDYLTYRGVGVYDAPFAANGSGRTGTIPLSGARLGDFVVWGADGAYLNECVTSYVQSDGVAALRVHNASGGGSDPVSRTFSVGVVPLLACQYRGFASYTPAAIANGATITMTATVEGAQVGAHTLVAYSADLQGLICTAHVSAANTVTIVVSNFTGADVTLASGGFIVGVLF